MKKKMIHEQVQERWAKKCKIFIIRTKTKQIIRQKKWKDSLQRYKNNKTMNLLLKQQQLPLLGSYKQDNGIRFFFVLFCSVLDDDDDDNK